MIQFTLEIHLFFITLLFLIPLRNLYVLFTEKDFILLARKIRFFGPMYHFFNTINAFTGSILMVLMNYYVGFELIFMVFVTLYLLMSEIKRYKKIRSITSKEYGDQAVFIRWAKKKYALDALIISGTTLLVMML